MKITRINSNLTTPHFLGVKNHKKEENQQTVPVLVNVSPDKLRSALKAAVLIPAAALPLVAGSCSNETEGCDEYWSGGHGTSIKYPCEHVLPECKVDTITFANDTVTISDELSENSKLNKKMNNVIDALKMPRLNNGTFPARLVFKTPDYIQYMLLDGVTSNDNIYAYDVQRYNNDGSLDMFKSEFSLDGEDLIMENCSPDNNSLYKFTTDNDTVNAYKRVNGEFVKSAVFYPTDDKNYSITKIAEDGDTTKFSNINLFCVKND